MDNPFRQALDEIENLKAGEEFLVKDLFKGYEWERLSVNDGRNLGRKFFDPTLNPHLAAKRIEPLDKTTSGQQRYKVSIGSRASQVSDETLERGIRFKGIDSCIGSS